MANTIRIKRTTTSNRPASLANAELAFIEGSKKLVYGIGTGGAGGTATSIIDIGGEGAFLTLNDVTQTADGEKTFLKRITLKTTAAPSFASNNVTENETAVTAGWVRGQAYSAKVSSSDLDFTLLGTPVGSLSIANTGITDGVQPTTTLALKTQAGLTAGTYTKLTISTKGIVTAAANLAASDIPTLTASKISDFDTAVRANRLDQLAVPTANVSLNSKRITSLADPVDPQDAATKAYVDASRAGLDIKDSCRVATTGVVGTTSNTTAIGGTPKVVDDVTLSVGDRVLVKSQSTASENGLYTVTVLGTGADGTWTRASDSSGSSLNSGAFVFIEQGTANGGTGWVLTTPNPIVMPQALTFTQFSGAGTYVAGAGLTQSGFTFNAVGTANRITVNADSIDIASTYVGQTSITTLGTIATGTWQGISVKAGYGGTGLTNYTAGDLLYAGTNDPVSLSRLAAPGAIGSALISGAAGAGPSWGKIGLTTHVSGTLPIANGGTNSTATPTLGGVSYGTGSAFAFTAAGTAGQALVSNGGAAPTWQTLTLENLPDAWVKRSVKAATTANITLSGAQTIDGIALVAGDRVLVKDQTTQKDNGIYVVSAGAWARAADANTAAYLAAAEVGVDAGTTNGGLTFTTNFKSDNTLGSTAVVWYQSYDSSQAKLANLLSTVFADNQMIRFTSATGMEAITVTDHVVNNLLNKIDANGIWNAIGLGTVSGTIDGLTIDGGSYT